MKKNLSLASILLVLFAHTAQAAPEATVSGCPLIAIPADSLAMKSDHPHVPSAAIWPRAPGMDYSGCVYVWLEGQPYYVARFESGRFFEGTTPDLLTDAMVLCRARPVDEESYSCGEMRKEMGQLLTVMQTHLPAEKASVPPAPSTGASAL